MLGLVALEHSAYVAHTDILECFAYIAHLASLLVKRAHFAAVYLASRSQFLDERLRVRTLVEERKRIPAENAPAAAIGILDATLDRPNESAVHRNVLTAIAHGYNGCDRVEGQFSKASARDHAPSSAMTL